MMGADYPAFILAGLMAVGGTMGYVKVGSTPSLIAGVGLGASYSLAGYLLRERTKWGSELALANSILLVTAGASRGVSTSWKSPVPIGLFATGSLATWYYLKKFQENRELKHAF